MATVGPPVHERKLSTGEALGGKIKTTSSSSAPSKKKTPSTKKETASPAEKKVRSRSRSGVRTATAAPSPPSANKAPVAAIAGALRERPSYNCLVCDAVFNGQKHTDDVFAGGTDSRSVLEGVLGFALEEDDVHSQRLCKPCYGRVRHVFDGMGDYSQLVGQLAGVKKKLKEHSSAGRQDSIVAVNHDDTSAVKQDQVAVTEPDAEQKRKKRKPALFRSSFSDACCLCEINFKICGLKCDSVFDGQPGAPSDLGALLGVAAGDAQSLRVCHPCVRRARKAAETAEREKEFVGLFAKTREKYCATCQPSVREIADDADAGDDDDEAGRNENEAVSTEDVFLKIVKRLVPSSLKADDGPELLLPLLIAVTFSGAVPRRVCRLREPLTCVLAETAMALTMPETWEEEESRNAETVDDLRDVVSTTETVAFGEVVTLHGDEPETARRRVLEPLYAVQVALWVAQAQGDCWASPRPSRVLHVFLLELFFAFQVALRVAQAQLDCWESPRPSRLEGPPALECLHPISVSEIKARFTTNEFLPPATHKSRSFVDAEPKRPLRVKLQKVLFAQHPYYMTSRYLQTTRTNGLDHTRVTRAPRGPLAQNMRLPVLEADDVQTDVEKLMHFLSPYADRKKIKPVSPRSATIQSLLSPFIEKRTNNGRVSFAHDAAGAPSQVKTNKSNSTKSSWTIRSPFTSKRKVHNVSSSPLEGATAPPGPTVVRPTVRGAPGGVTSSLPVATAALREAEECLRSLMDSLQSYKAPLAEEEEFDVDGVVKVCMLAG